MHSFVSCAQNHKSKLDNLTPTPTPPPHLPLHASSATSLGRIIM